MKSRVRALALVAALTASAPALCVTITEYDLANANASEASFVNALPTPPGVTATPLSASGALGEPFFVDGTFMHANWPSGDSPDLSKYYQFSVTAQPGRSIQYEQISLAVASGGVGTGAFQISASFDGFATPGQVLHTQSFPKDVTWHAFDLDLTALGVEQGTVTFRFTMFQVGSGAFSGLGISPNYGNQGRNLSIAGTVLEGEPPAGCTPTATTLCIDDQPGDRRFQARVTFETTQGSMPAGSAKAIPLNSLGIPSGGIFWFTSQTNPEMLIKVLPGCGFNNHYWVFYAAGTNFALRTEVIDTQTGATWVRTNPDRTVAPPIGDLFAFPCGQATVDAPALSRADAAELWNPAGGAATRRHVTVPREACSPDATTLCIDRNPGDRRYEARVFYSTTQGSQPQGFANAIPLTGVGVPSGGIFWFTNPQNPEMLLKVLPGCSFNNRVWVFYSAGTNFGLEVEVTDTATGTVWTSVNPDRRQAPPVGDINAFPCSP